MQVGGEGNPVGRIRLQAVIRRLGTNKGDGGIYFKSLRPLLLLCTLRALCRKTLRFSDLRRGSPARGKRKSKKVSDENFRISFSLYWVQWRFNFAGIGVVVFVIKFAAWSHRTFFPGVFSCISVVCLSMLPVSLLAQSAAQIQNSAVKSIEIPVLSGEVDIDGELDESVWSRAILIEDLHQVFPEEYVAPSEPTQVRVFYSEDALYIGAVMIESNPDAIVDRVLRQGQSLSGDDVFAVILDPYLDRRNGYRFEVNPNGVRWEGLFQNIIEVEGNWQGIWEVRSQRHAQGWTAEIRIPFQSLSFNPDSSVWGINFNRIRRGANENIAWMSYNREINPSTSGHSNGPGESAPGRRAGCGALNDRAS